MREKVEETEAVVVLLKKRRVRKKRYLVENQVDKDVDVL